MKSINQSLFHLILVSNGSKKFLTRVNQQILYNYMQGMLNSKRCEPFIISGNANHVHIAVDISPEISVQKIIKELQTNTTDFIRRENSVFPEFTGWDTNFVSISYHRNQLKELNDFISNQYNFHKNNSFESELELLIAETKTVFTGNPAS
jgi:putative transposase